METFPSGAPPCKSSDTPNGGRADSEQSTSIYYRTRFHQSTGVHSSPAPVLTPSWVGQSRLSDNPDRLDETWVGPMEEASCTLCLVIQILHCSLHLP